MIDNDELMYEFEELNSEIWQLVTALRATDPSSEDYKIISQNLKTLIEARKSFIEGNSAKRKTERENEEFILEQSRIMEENDKAQMEEKAEQELNGFQKFWNEVDKTRVLELVVITGLVIVTLKHEELHVITGKAAQLVLKLVHV